jgi:hypothetical protein
MLISTYDILFVIGTYASWFTTQSTETTSTTQQSLLMNAISYVVAALPEPSLCLQAANALRDLCDANRAELAPHIGAFAELHAGLTGVPVRSSGSPKYLFHYDRSLDRTRRK